MYKSLFLIVFSSLLALAGCDSDSGDGGGDNAGCSSLCQNAPASTLEAACVADFIGDAGYDGSDIPACEAANESEGVCLDCWSQLGVPSSVCADAEDRCFASAGNNGGNNGAGNNGANNGAGNNGANNGANNGGNNGGQGNAGCVSLCSSAPASNTEAECVAGFITGAGFNGDGISACERANDSAATCLDCWTQLQVPATVCTAAQQLCFR
jgi:hypothetical protein